MKKYEFPDVLIIRGFTRDNAQAISNSEGLAKGAGLPMYRGFTTLAVNWGISR